MQQTTECYVQVPDPEWRSKQKPDLELQRFTDALQLLGIVGRDHRVDYHLRMRMS